MHFRRLVVAIILLPLLYLYITRLSQIFFFLLVLSVSVAAQWEFYSIYRIKGIMKWLGISAGMFILIDLNINKIFLYDAIALSFIIISFARMVGKRDPASSLYEISPVLLSLIYIPGLLGFQILLRGIGSEWIIFLYGCVWASDSLAYYAGKTMGGKKLYMEISPNKTIAGAYGSIIGGALSGWLLGMIFIRQMGLSRSILLGLVIGIATIIGDLVESMFKRDAGVKDSGNIIPGHGGILDKIDGALFAGPVLYWLSSVLALIS